MKQTRCRCCGALLHHLYTFGTLPLPNVFSARTVSSRYPLILCYCRSCGLVQLGYIVDPKKIFPKYGYVSSASAPLVSHLSAIAKDSIRRYRLGKHSKVLDIGANDGTLLSAFGPRVGVRVGIDPAGAVTHLAHDAGIHMIHDFFGERAAHRLVRGFGQFDLITCTHTLANIVDFGDFFRGIDRVLSPTGAVIFEVGLADPLTQKGRFDSVYHEHYAYFSKESLSALLGEYHFVVTDMSVEPIQGASLLIHATRGVPAKWKHTRARLSPVRFRQSVERYTQHMKRLVGAYKGKMIVGFGAPAKAVTLVHVCELASHISAFVDSTPAKQGRLFPGTNRRIYPESYLTDHRPDAVILFSWSYADVMIPKLKTLVREPIDVIIPFPKLIRIRVK